MLLSWTVFATKGSKRGISWDAVVKVYIQGSRMNELQLIEVMAVSSWHASPCASCEVVMVRDVGWLCGASLQYLLGCFTLPLWSPGIFRIRLRSVHDCFKCEQSNLAGGTFDKDWRATKKMVQLQLGLFLQTVAIEKYGEQNVRPQSKHSYARAALTTMRLCGQTPTGAARCIASRMRNTTEMRS
eukprot:4076648-Amphidinium_carterae.1